MQRLKRVVCLSFESLHSAFHHNVNNSIFASFSKRRKKGLPNPSFCWKLENTY